MNNDKFPLPKNVENFGMEKMVNRLPFTNVLPANYFCL